MTVDFTSDGEQVISAGADMFVAFIDASSGKMVRRLPRATQPILYLEVSPDGASIATLYMNAENLTLPGPLAIWNVSTGRKQQELLPATVALSSGWTRDGHLVYVTAAPDSLQIWRIH